MPPVRRNPREPVLWELLDVVERVFTLACTVNLDDVLPEDHVAGCLAYQVDHGMSMTRLREALRGNLNTMREVRAYTAKAKLDRLYWQGWRPCEPSEARRGGLRRRNVHVEERSAAKTADWAARHPKKRATRKTAVNSSQVMSKSVWDTGEDTLRSSH